MDGDYYYSAQSCEDLKVWDMELTISLPDNKKQYITYWEELINVPDYKCVLNIDLNELSGSMKDYVILGQQFVEDNYINVSGTDSVNI
jgi:hypothetical protein